MVAKTFYNSAYRHELEEEIASLIRAQRKFPSEYKADRIKRLSERLGLTGTDIEERKDDA